MGDEFDDVRSLGCGTLLLTKVGDCNNNRQSIPRHRLAFRSRADFCAHTECLWESTLLHGNITILRYLSSLSSRTTTS